MNRFIQTVAMGALVLALAPVQAEAAQPRSAKKEAASASKPTRVSKTFIAGKAVERRSVVRLAPAAPPRPSFGQLAGLHATPDDLDLKSSVALVIDQDTHQVLLRKNDAAVLPSRRSRS